MNVYTIGLFLTVGNDRPQGTDVMILWCAWYEGWQVCPRRYVISISAVWLEDLSRTIYSPEGEHRNANILSRTIWQPLCPDSKRLQRVMIVLRTMKYLDATATWVPRSRPWANGELINYNDKPYKFTPLVQSFLYRKTTGGWPAGMC